MSAILTSFLLLGTSLFSFWLTRMIWVIGALILVGVGLATYLGNISIVGLSALLVLGLFIYLEHKQINRAITRLFSCLIGIFAFAFFTHLIPGFHNYLWLSQVKLSALSAPLNVYLNFDKTIAACIVGLGLYYAKPKIFSGLFQKNVFKRVITTSLFISALCIALLMGLGLALHYVVVDIKFSALFWLWFVHNLVFVCIAEELVFRGYIQTKLTGYFIAKQHSWMWGLIIASVIFGLLHFRGGPLYIGLAAVAGMFYGYAYHKTKRIEASILVHLLLNTVHFIFFSYPYAAG